MALAWLSCAVFAISQGSQLPKYTVATLPAASTLPHYIVQVIDGVSSSDCATGGGSQNVICISNGTSWTTQGGGSGTINASTAQYEVPYYIGAAGSTTVGGTGNLTYNPVTNVLDVGGTPASPFTIQNVSGTATVSAPLTATAIKSSAASCATLTPYMKYDGSCASSSGGGNTTSTSLTTNKLPKSNGTNSIVDSSVGDNGTTVSTLEQFQASSLTATVGTVTPSLTLNGGNPLTGQSSANSQIVTCNPGGSSTQYCGADGAWHPVSTTTISTYPVPQVPAAPYATRTDSVFCADGDSVTIAVQGMTVSITAYSISSNVVTFTINNRLLVAGQVFTLSSFPTSTFLNSQNVTVLASGLAPGTFKANFTHANVSLTTEAGTGTGSTVPYTAFLASTPLGVSLFGSNIYNYGVSGQNNTQILARYSTSCHVNCPSASATQTTCASGNGLVHGYFSDWSAWNDLSTTNKLPYQVEALWAQEAALAHADGYKVIGYLVPIDPYFSYGASNYGDDLYQDLNNATMEAYAEGVFDYVVDLNSIVDSLNLYNNYIGNGVPVTWTAADGRHPSNEWNNQWAQRVASTLFVGFDQSAHVRSTQATNMTNGLASGEIGVPNGGIIQSGRAYTPPGPMAFSKTCYETTTTTGLHCIVSGTGVPSASGFGVSNGGSKYLRQDGPPYSYTWDASLLAWQPDPYGASGMIYPGANTLAVANSGNTGWRTPLWSDITALMPAQYRTGSCTEVWVGSGTSNALQSGDDAVSNNTCYNDSGATRTITAVKCRSDNASNTATTNPTFGSAGTGTTILIAAITCGSSYAYSASGSIANASWTTGTGIDPGMSGTLTGTSIALIVEYTF